MAKKKQTRTVSYLFLMINTICWGAALILVKPALDITNPFRFLLYRYMLAVILTLPYLMKNLKKFKKIKQIKKIVLLELIGTTTALTFLYLGLQKTSAIEASFLANTTPIFTVIAGLILLKEKEEKKEAIGLIMAFIGTIMLTVLPVMNGFVNGHQISLIGNLFIIVNNTATAIYFVFAKKIYKNISKFMAAVISFHVGLISFFVLNLVSTNFRPLTLAHLIVFDLKHLSVWWASIYMALFGSIIGLTAYIKGQDGVEVSEATVFTYLQPLIYVPLGIIFLGESIGPVQIISLAIILLGVIVAEKK